MASPHVAGVAALYLGTNPTALPSAVGDALTANASTGLVTIAGTGSPDRLLYSLFGGSTTPPANIAPTAAFTSSCTDLTCTFTDGSTDSGGTIASWSWTFGDGDISTLQNPRHTYATGGPYTVTLTVTDNGGLTDKTVQDLTVTAPAAGISLTATGYKVKGLQHTDLKWSGATSTSVDVYRNDVNVKTTANDGGYIDDVGTKGSGSYTYKVCEAGNATCSASVTVTF
jgi:PKD repeat protein